MAGKAGGDGDGLRAVPTRREVAIHEAAHAVYAHRQGLGINSVTVAGVVALENGAERTYGMSFGRCYYDDDGEVAGIWLTAMACALSLVGAVAEHRAGYRAEDVPLSYGEFMEDAEGWHPRSDFGKVLHILGSKDDPKSFYEAARKEVGAFVEERWDEIVALAEILMEEESVGASEVSAVCGNPGWAEFREMLDRMRYEDDLAPWVKAAMEEAGTDDPDRITFGPDGGVIVLEPYE